jgi:uncharacterized protein (DUF934 family)
MTLITDTGFAEDDLSLEFTDIAKATITSKAIFLPADTDLSGDVLPSNIGGFCHVQAICIGFDNFGDGRGFTLARRLRVAGFTGRLRAHGHVLSDQYAMARRSGFDEVEISDAQALRQPETDWLARSNWRENDYQTRLRGIAALPPL